MGIEQNGNPLPSYEPLEASEKWAKYIGVPFLNGGRDRYGWDCWGLVHYISRVEFGRELPSYSGEYADAHDREEIGALVNRELVERWVQVPAGAERSGDVALFRVTSEPTHTGLIVDPDAGTFIHVRPGVGTCIESYRRWRWRRRVIGFYRLK
jgi:cell wall-associated NlpC family hydrolase